MTAEEREPRAFTSCLLLRVRVVGRQEGLGGSGSSLCGWRKCQYTQNEKEPREEASLQPLGPTVPEAMPQGLPILQTNMFLRRGLD